MHSAYEGWMPPEHAGAATAYLALRLAGEFHGQQVTGYEVLERAGVIQSGLESTDEELPAALTGPGDKLVAVSREEILRLIQELSSILSETALEFEKIPVFFRSFARNGFKAKAGASLVDWQRRLTDFQSKLEHGNESLENAQNLLPQLEKLAVYYQETPKEMARFTKDKELLANTTEIAKQRCATIRRLVETLSKIQ